MCRNLTLLAIFFVNSKFSASNCLSSIIAQSWPIKNLFGRIVKTSFLMFEDSQFNEYWSEIGYQSISMDLIMSSSNVVKWISDFENYLSVKARRTKIYPSKLGTFLTIRKTILVNFLKKIKTWCLPAFRQHRFRNILIQH